MYIDILSHTLIFLSTNIELQPEVIPQIIFEYLKVVPSDNPQLMSRYKGGLINI